MKGIISGSFFNIIIPEFLEVDGDVIEKELQIHFEQIF